MFNYDFKKAANVYLDMSDTQLIWLRHMIERESREASLKSKLEQTRMKVFRGGRYGRRV